MIETETLNLTAMARINDDLIKARCTPEQATEYNAWFTTVYEPTL